jgi:peptidoglycan/LPS O-acetylase OafA/YrhL
MAYWALDSAWRFTSNYRFHMEVASTGMFASCFLAIYWTSAKKPQSRFALPALLVLAFAANLAQVPPALQVVLGGTAFALAINLVDQSNGLIRNVLESRVLQRLGEWSFSIFLWQQPFHLMANQGDIDAVTGIVGALACGITAFHLIENPARAWLNRNWAPRTRLTLAYSATVSPSR